MYPYGFSVDSLNLEDLFVESIKCIFASISYSADCVFNDNKLCNFRKKPRLSIM